jgi:hypothetical protein
MPFALVVIAATALTSTGAMTAPDLSAGAVPETPVQTGAPPATISSRVGLRSSERRVKASDPQASERLTKDPVNHMGQPGDGPPSGLGRIFKGLRPGRCSAASPMVPPSSWPARGEPAIAFCQR